MEINQEHLGTDILTPWSTYLIGLDISKQGTWCAHECSTDKFNNFIVAVFNPSLETVNRTRIEVAKG